MTRDEVNYEQKVKQFVEDTNKYRKDRKPGSDDKSSSRKKEKHKKRKSSQRDSKKSKRSKEKRSKTSKRDKRDSSKSGLGDLENLELREALKYVARFKITILQPANIDLFQDHKEPARIGYTGEIVGNGKISSSSTPERVSIFV